MTYIMVLIVTKFREDRLNRSVFQIFSKNPWGAILPPPPPPPPSTVQIGLIGQGLVYLTLFEGVSVALKRAVCLIALKAISMDSHDN